MSFLSCSFVWVNRSCNNAAHTATKFAIESNVSFFLVRVIFPPVWQLLVGKTPPFVSLFLSQYIADYKKKNISVKYFFLNDNNIIEFLFSMKSICCKGQP